MRHSLAPDQLVDDLPLRGGSCETAELYNPLGGASLLLICDHASASIPRELENLGLDRTQFARHIALDIGAAEVTRRLADRLDAPAVLCRFSRLLIDPNRKLDDPTSILQIADGVVVPGNRCLTAEAREARVGRFFRPYHSVVEDYLDDLMRRAPAPAVISIHSFTPMLHGQRRPWEIGVLWNRDPRLPRPLLERLGENGVVVGDNEPYTGRGGYGYTIDVPVEARGLANVLIEVRQDLIDTHHGVEDWSRRLGEVLAEILAPMALIV